MIDIRLPRAIVCSSAVTDHAAGARPMRGLSDSYRVELLSEGHLTLPAGRYGPSPEKVGGSQRPHSPPSPTAIERKLQAHAASEFVQPEF